MGRIIATLALVLVVAACGRTCPPAATAVSAPTAPGGSPAVIGQTFTLTSKVLGEDRIVNVYLPPGYAESKDSYPVLYMPDGGMDEDFPHISGHLDVSIKNAVIRPVILVGVKNTERRRDLAPPTAIEEEKKAAPHAGGSDKFRQFLREELKPWVAAHYRVTAESGLIGESLAGLFAIETLVVEPSLFDIYIAADPSLWWNQLAVVKTAEARFATWSESPKQLFVATGDLKDMQEGAAALVKAIAEKQPAGLTVTYVPMPEEQHGTIFPFAALRGIRTVYAAPPAPAAAQ
ncbi:MAG TPA: alpha/beta hydrolase-fold protein [Kofleriaceae bacterium]|nr:alpha/beta hydrolase-fold protein [Kofleriaceae bacterium]